MNARDKLKWALRDPSAFCLCGEQGCPTADTLIDDFAHDLAERIYEWADTFGDSTTGKSMRAIVREGVALIDPHTAPDDVPDTCGPGCRCDPNKL